MFAPSKRIDFVGGARGPRSSKSSCDRAVPPSRFRCIRSSVDDLMAIADAGGIMPPKSTWFEPKLRDGLLSHVISSTLPDHAASRIFNFSAGPAVLPLPVLEQAQRELVSLPGVGMSVMEISHRSKVFEDLLNGAIADIRELAGVPANYQILMLQGGASLQFSMVPMNLLGPGATADYVDTGTWADKAIKEAKRVGTVNVTGSTKADNYNRIPTPGRAHAHARRGLRAHHHEQHHRRHRVADAARRRRRAARRRRVVRHLQSVRSTSAGSA